MNRIPLIKHFLGNKSEIRKDIKYIFDSNQLTNFGNYYSNFKESLSAFLQLDSNKIELACNGTIGLLLGAKALDLKKKVIISPYTFPATVNMLQYLNIEPIFCDIDPKNLCIDTKKIEELIDNDVTGIISTHVYGNYPDFKKINLIAKKYNLKVLYDASHSFNQQTLNKKSIFNQGDLSVGSLHSSKLLNSIEGGLLHFKKKSDAKKFRLLQNFGIKNENTVVSPGLNGKLNEIQAAVGINNLKHLDYEIKRRKKIVDLYYKHLITPLHGKIRLLLDKNNHSYQYYPILIERHKKNSRDTIYKLLKENNIESRKYFYPLTSNYKFFKKAKSAAKERLKVANYISSNVLCLPFYGSLTNKDIKKISSIIINALEN